MLLLLYFTFSTVILLGLGGNLIGKQGSIFISISNIFFALVISYHLFYKIIFLKKVSYISCIPWIHSGLFQCNWEFLFDSITSVMLIVILSISTIVHIYSSSYMSEDAHIIRFMTYLSLFTFFMIILVTAGNLLQAFIGWEGVGFCSYLLINFWHTRLQANKAAIKAMLVNRISDLLLVLGLLTIFINLKTIDYVTIFAMVPLLKDISFIFFNLPVNIIDTICLLLLLGAMGKSAQLFLHTWLPDAMEGPTPVSALIHAATMVTAGVFLIVRCSPIFEYSLKILNVMTIVGGSTAFFAGTIGLVQNDIKRVIAYSTCSQLGYMFLACGVSNYLTGIFHLYNHAFFKALLFLSAGVVIHSLSDEQDMRKMGGLRRILPFTYMMFIIGSLALMGFPFLTGFYSKDVILEVSYATHNKIGHFAYWLGTIAAFCTAFYSIRLIYFVFLNKNNSFKRILIGVHDVCNRMLISLSFLAFGSIFLGYLSRDFFIGLGTSFWGSSIFIKPLNIYIIDAEFLPVFIKILPVLFSLFGMFLASYLYTFKLNEFYLYKISNKGLYIYNFLNRKWYFDKIYNELIVQNLLNISYYKTYKLIDRGIIELFGPFGISSIIYTISKNLKFIQTGYIYHYTFFMLFGLIILLSFLLYNYIFYIIFISTFYLIIK